MISAPCCLKACRNTNSWWSSGSNSNQIALELLLWHCPKEHSGLGSKSYNAFSGMLIEAFVYLGIVVQILCFCFFDRHLMFMVMVVVVQHPGCSLARILCTHFPLILHFCLSHCSVTVFMLQVNHTKRDLLSTFIQKLYRYAYKQNIKTFLLCCLIRFLLSQ